MTEYADNRHLDILLLEVLLVALADIDQGKEGEKNVEHMSKLASLFPWRNLRRIGLLIEVVDTTVEPVTVAIDVELLEVTELILRVVLQVVRDDLIFLSRLRLVLESIGSHQARGFKRHEVLRIVAGVPSRESSTLLLAEDSQALGTTAHKSSRQHIFFNYNYKEATYLHEKMQAKFSNFIAPDSGILRFEFMKRRRIDGIT